MLAEQRALRAAVERMDGTLQRLVARRDPVSARPALDALLPAVAGVLGSEWFTSADVFALAQRH
jgi:hypothetical protein